MSKGFELPVLVEVNDAQCVRALDGAGGGHQFATQQAKQCGFAAAIGTHQPDAHARREGEIELRKSVRSAISYARSSSVDQPLALAVAGGEIDVGSRSSASRCDLRQLADHLMRLIDARLRLGRPRFRAAPQPFDLRANSILQRFLRASAPREIPLFLQEAAVVAGVRRMPLG